MAGTTMDIWNLVDCLGVPVRVKANYQITCTAHMYVDLEGLELPVPFRIVSSAMTNQGPVVLCRSLGNLALLAATRAMEGAEVSIWVLNLAKMDNPESLIEKIAPKHPLAVVEVIKDAVVQVFNRDASYQWHPVVPSC